MDVTCPACAAQYTANDDKLRGKTARMRCKACNTVWLVPGPSAEKRAAVVRTGAAREKRDLFAERELDEGSVKQTLLPPPTGLGGPVLSGFAARNENSVLFSLDQLSPSARRTAARPASAAPIPSTPRRVQPVDDEGVIDLHALSSPPRHIGAVVPPLFSEPAPMALDVRDSGEHAPQGKGFGKPQLFGMIAAAAAFFLVATFGIAAMFRGEEPVVHAAAPLAFVPPPVTVDPPTAPQSTPATTASSDDSDADATDGDEVATKTKSRKTKARRSGARSKGVVASPAPKPKRVKPADPCHCKGDLNCILACTVKRGH